MKNPSSPLTFSLNIVHTIFSWKTSDSASSYQFSSSSIFLQYCSIMFALGLCAQFRKYTNQASPDLQVSSNQLSIAPLPPFSISLYPIFFSFYSFFLFFFSSFLLFFFFSFVSIPGRPYTRASCRAVSSHGSTHASATNLSTVGPIVKPSDIRRQHLSFSGQLH